MIPDHIVNAFADAETAIAELQRAIAPITEKRTRLEARLADVVADLAGRTAERTEMIYRGERVERASSRIRELTDERDALNETIATVASELAPLEQQREETTARRARLHLSRAAHEARDRALAAMRARDEALARLLAEFPRLARAAREAVDTMRVANRLVENEPYGSAGNLDLFENGAQANLGSTIEMVALHTDPTWLEQHLAR